MGLAFSSFREKEMNVSERKMAKSGSDNPRTARHIIAFGFGVNAGRDDNDDGGKSNHDDLDVRTAASAQ